jgi:hypothetical protein
VNGERKVGLRQPKENADIGIVWVETSSMIQMRIRMSEDGFNGIVGIGWVADFLNSMPFRLVVGGLSSVMLAV